MTKEPGLSPVFFAFSVLARFSTRCSLGVGHDELLDRLISCRIGVMKVAASKTCFYGLIVHVIDALDEDVSNTQVGDKAKFLVNSDEGALEDLVGF